MINGLWLETYLTLCEIGHFTRAAAAMNMTQPGVSQHIQKLELQLGTPLLTRDGKSFTPTPAGEALLVIARRRRDEERDLKSVLQNDDPDRGDVTLACSGSLALMLYPSLLDMMARAPALSIRLEAMPQTRILEGVATGAIDLGIVDHTPVHPRLIGARAGSEDLCLITPATAPSVTCFADLEAIGFIGHPDGFAHADELLSLNFPRDYPGADRLRQRSFINQIGQIPEPVARGLGYTILPRSGIDTFSGRHMLKVEDLKVAVRHDLWIVQRKGRILPKRAERTRETVSAILKKL
ncbi:LysR family transcriptional regulator [Albirhodobacter sp. R86504]|uniref:LysR family transcriptional regulator n=1 Tax=Albirhodobacter sp. R86504 TaxID=3093848 RepID=UPI00366DD7BE